MHLAGGGKAWPTRATPPQASPEERACARPNPEEWRCPAMATASGPVTDRRTHKSTTQAAGPREETTPS
eukprot:12290797-Alexandrium_andersonii.AAC.1